MAERALAAVLVAVFACFLYSASMDMLRLIEDRQFGEIFLLLFCVIACVGWIGFLASLALSGGAAAFRTHTGWRPVEE